MSSSPPGPAPAIPAKPVSEGMLIDLTAVLGPTGANPTTSAPVRPEDDVAGFDVPDRIMFTYTFDAFDESKTASYNEVPIIGRSEPIFGYSHSNARTFNIPLTFVATDNPFEEIIKPIWLIRSWVYPEYGTLDIPNVPPRVLLVMGNWLSQRCIATRVDIRYEKPWGRVTLNQAGQRIQGSGQNTVPGGRGGDPNLDSMMPYKAEVQLVLQEVTENTTYTPWDTTWVRRGWDRGSGFF
jgi:hypothetical protein